MDTNEAQKLLAQSQQQRKLATVTYPNEKFVKGWVSRLNPKTRPYEVEMVVNNNRESHMVDFDKLIGVRITDEAY